MMMTAVYWRKQKRSKADAASFVLSSGSESGEAGG